jgi:hypothetical protein
MLRGLTELQLVRQGYTGLTSRIHAYPKMGHNPKSRKSISLLNGTYKDVDNRGVGIRVKNFLFYL